MSAQKIEVPGNVLQAIKKVVEYNYYSTTGDDTDIIINDLPVIHAWLTELGLLPPLDTEEPGRSHAPLT
jgi:hypothetical protein